MSGEDTQHDRPSETGRNIFRTVLSFLGMLTFLIFCAAVIWGSWTRTFLLEARSFGTTLVLSGETNTWDLESSVLCTSLDAPARQVVDGGLCPRTIFTISEQEPRAIDWPSGAKLQIQLQSDDSLRIEAVSGAAPALADGNRLVVPPEVWRRHGALAVNGSVLFGGHMGSGASDYLISGRWEARQDSLASAMFRPTMEVVKSGEFTRGASAEIWRYRWLFGRLGEARQATVFGHITPSHDPDAPGLILSFLSEAAPVEMHLRYYGLDNFAVVRPDIIDTILTSPVLLAAIAILTVAALIADLVVGLRKERSAGAKSLVWLKRPRSRKY